MAEKQDSASSQQLAGMGIRWASSYPQPAWGSVLGERQSISVQSVLTSRWGQRGIGGDSAQTLPAAEGQPHLTHSGARGQVQTDSSARGPWQGFSSEVPISPCSSSRSLFSHKAPASLPPSCDLKTGLSFWGCRGSTLLARPLRCTASAILPEILVFMFCRRLLHSPEFSQKGACSEANARSRWGLSFT